MGEGIGAEACEPRGRDVPIRRVLVNIFECLGPVVRYVEGDGIRQESGKKGFVSHAFKLVFFRAVHEFLETQDIHISRGSSPRLGRHKLRQAHDGEAHQDSRKNGLPNRIRREKDEDKATKYHDKESGNEKRSPDLLRVAQKILLSYELSIEAPL